LNNSIFKAFFHFFFELLRVLAFYNKQRRQTLVHFHFGFLAFPWLFHLHLFPSFSITTSFGQIGVIF